jgi:hypothetical protein
MGGLSKVKLHNENIDGDILTYEIELKQNKPITLFCNLQYAISLNQILKHHIRVSGDMTIDEYKKVMKSNDIDTVFTLESPKIQFSSYVSNIATNFNGTNTIAFVWDKLTDILDKDIRYDWNKRSLFFSGRKTYNDIKDMYMTTKELGESKLGACPERSSLEAAVLRHLGISARTTTRLYHIFVEAYLPDITWVTTSGILNEIPLCVSPNHKQSYFVSWEPGHPIKLKWEGGLYPAVLY